MSRFSIGVMVDSFRLPLEEGIAKAREVGLLEYRYMLLPARWLLKIFQPLEEKKF